MSVTVKSTSHVTTQSTGSNTAQVIPQGPPGSGGGGAVDSVNGRTGAVTLTSADVGLSNVNNTSDADKPVSTAQAAADAAVLASANATTAAHAARTDNPHTVTAAQLGLGNVENKSSATIRSEITSGNVTTALGYTPENAAQKGTAGGYAPLDGTGKVASTYLPSYVDDVLEYANLAAFPGTGETGKMYVALDTNKVYRWSGSAYVEISGSPGSTDAVPEGASNLYFTAARVLATVLSGLSTATNAVITAADTVLSALGKLQKQISDNLTTLTTHTGNTSNPHGTTAAQVGAVAKAGDTMTGALNWATTQTIASAATTDIGAATSNSVIVSGTTTITALGTIAAGAERVVQFSGALTLTHNATSLILPGGASITTAAGDVAYFVSLGSGNWRCTGYQKANGQSVVSSGGISGLTAARVPFASNSTTLVDDAGLTYDSTNKALTVGGATVTTSNPVATFSQVFNGSGITFVGKSNDFTDTLSAAASLLERWRVGGTMLAAIRKDGRITLTGELNSTSNTLMVTTTDGNIVRLDAAFGSIQAYKNLTMSKATATITGDGASGAAGFAPLTVQGGNCGNGQDGASGLTLHGGNASPNAATHIVGGTTILRGGDGSSGSAGAAHGGPVHIAGGAPFGTGSAGVVNLAYTGSAARGTIKAWATLTMDAPILLKSYTVATLPTAASNTHAIVAVTDGNASPTYRGAVTGGGSTKGVVYCDGSSWMWH